MGKSASPSLHQRKGLSNHNDEDDTDILEEFSGSDGSQTRWLLLIVVLLVVNGVLGYIHIKKRTQPKEPSVVKALTDEGLPYHIAGHPNGTLVIFFMRDCADCKKLAPEFEAAAKQLQHIGDTSLVAVNAALAPLAVKRYGVTKFPSLLWFRRGELLKDVPPAVRTTPKILEFVDQSLQPSVIDFTTHADFDEAVPQLRSVLQNESLPVMVGFGRTPGVYKVLLQAAEKFRGMTAFLFVKETREGDPLIRAYFREAHSDKDYSGAVASQELQAWLQPLLVKEKKNLST